MNKTILILLTTTLVAVANHLSQAGSATWSASPATGDWDTAANWMPQTVPNGPTDLATFGISNTTGISLSAATEVNAITYNAGANGFTTTVPDGLTFTISGTGIGNNSGVMQNFVAGATASNGGIITFLNQATAGSLTTFVNQGGAAVSKSGGTLLFENSSSAGASTIMNSGAAVTNGLGAVTAFHDNSTAGEATIIANAATAKTLNFGQIDFFDNSTAGNSQITIKPPTAGTAGGFVAFLNTSTAANATITLEGSLTRFGVTSLYFEDSSTAGNATIILEASPRNGAGSTVQFFGGNGGSARLEIFGQSSAGAGTGGAGRSWGSIEGDGTVFVGSPSLAIGSNNLSTTFTGLLADAFQVGPLVKVGSGTLTLGGANTYTGGTTILSGALIVTNAMGSATGTGAVNVNGGTLGGSGRISGPVTIGTNTRTRAFLAPSKGVTETATLTIESALTLNGDATYTYKLDAKHAEGDEVIANGATIDSDATFAFRPSGLVSTLMIGQTITVINNTATTPISGTFHNLAQNEVLFATGNYLRVSYIGGDGNDLTLTVIK